MSSQGQGCGPPEIKIAQAWEETWELALPGGTWRVVRWAVGVWGGTGGHYMHPHPWPGPQVYTVELHIGKVVLGDRGDYRIEVKAKDLCDSCAFNIDVEGMLVRVGAKVLGSGWGGQICQPGVGIEYRGGGEVGTGFWRMDHRGRDPGIQTRKGSESVSCSVVSDFVTSWAAAHQPPLSMGFSRQEYWSGLPFSSPGDLPD